MFSIVPHFAISFGIEETPEGEYRQTMAPAHKYALVADVLLGMALVVIGMCAAEWGFIPYQYPVYIGSINLLGALLLTALKLNSMRPIIKLVNQE